MTWSMIVSTLSNRSSGMACMVVDSSRFMRTCVCVRGAMRGAGGGDREGHEGEGEEGKIREGERE